MQTPQTASPPQFVHLHLHSEYSLLDGGNSINRLVKRVRELGMPAVAVTDHGNLHGAVEFYAKARAAGVKPILGIEAYVAPGDRTDRTNTPLNNGGFHLVLLAENNTGWRNLVRLSSDSFVNGFYYKPRMDRSTLARHAEGLIAINGHLGSSIAHHLLLHAQTGTASHYQAALEEARWHAEAFGTNERGEPCFYVELQNHSVAEQRRINPLLVELARELDLPLVCDNDVHYLTRDDYDMHDSLCCISMQKTKEDPSRIRYSHDLYLKSPAEMAELFPDLPDAIANTTRIGERCNVELDFEANHAPVVKIVYAGGATLPADAASAGRLVEQFDCPDPVGSTAWYDAFCRRFRLEPYDRDRDQESQDQLEQRCDGALRSLAEAGAVWRYGAQGLDDAKRARLDRELTILADKRISAYFLIVWDVVSWARQQGIPAAARGSGVGTMVGYVLGLSNACPQRYGLLFERFTDPDRSEYPDIDVDICQDGRARVIEYVREKYGHVAQIITFGRLMARAAVKDVARVMGFTPAEGQRLSNLIPNELNITLDAALKKEPEFSREYENDPRIRSVVDTAMALEGHARHAGVHAAGVVVATEPLDNIVPLCRATGSDDIVTQWDGPTCERVGLLKMDFLGLRTLSTVERTRVMIREGLPEAAIWVAVGRTPDDGGPHPLDLDRLAFDDQRVLELFRRADTMGVFQFESSGMRKLLAQMKPDRLEDLIAANALFRPGPMELIDAYCQRKHGRQPVPNIHPIVDEHTAETYGIMVYQEQVMQIVHGLGDIPLRRAYSLIKAISKKKHAVIDAERPRFIDGAVNKGLSERQANELFDLIYNFAGYGFNKSHSTGYAIVAYQTAYLKTYFPNQYMASVLTFESSARKVEDWVPYLQAARQTVLPDSTPAKPHVGVVVRPPDINSSDRDFTVVFEDSEPRDAVHGHVRFGLGAIKGVGPASVDTIMQERDANGPFKSIFDFCERVNVRTLNRANIEALVACGAFDSVHGFEQRAAAHAAVEDAISAGQAAADDRANGQLSFFGGGDDSPEAPAGQAAAVERPLPAMPPWERLTALTREKETLGFHISGHPLDDHEAILDAFCTATATGVANLRNGANVTLGGLLNRVRILVTRRGRSAGQRMAQITLEDRTDSIDGVVFSETFSKYATLLQEGAAVIVAGRVDHSQGTPQIQVDRVVSLHQAPQHLAKRIEIDLRDDDPHDDFQDRVRMVHGVLQQAATGPMNEGTPAAVHVRLHRSGEQVVMRCNRLRVIPDPYLLNSLRDMVGEQGVHVYAR